MKLVAAIVDGEVIAVPIILNAITGGSFQLNTPSLTEANDLLKRLGC